MWPFPKHKKYDGGDGYDEELEATHTCVICSETIGRKRQDGSTEIAYKLPCGHIFGSSCILRWLDTSPKQDCPNCRRRMLHSGCGHLILPHNSTCAPACIAAEDIPPLCVRCRGEGGVAKVLKAEFERLVVQEEALKGLRVLLPSFVGSSGVRLTGRNVDDRIGELRTGFAGFHERAWRRFAEMERRDVW